MSERFSQINAAYDEALAAHDPADVDAVRDLLPAILAAVPDAGMEEIAAALEWAADQTAREAEALRRYRNGRRSQQADTCATCDEPLTVAEVEASTGHCFECFARDVELRLLNEEPGTTET